MRARSLLLLECCMSALLHVACEIIERGKSDCGDVDLGRPQINNDKPFGLLKLSDDTSLANKNDYVSILTGTLIGGNNGAENDARINAAKASLFYQKVTFSRTCGRESYSNRGEWPVVSRTPRVRVAVYRIRWCRPRLISKRRRR